MLSKTIDLSIEVLIEKLIGIEVCLQCMYIFMYVCMWDRFEQKKLQDYHYMFPNHKAGNAC